MIRRIRLIEFHEQAWFPKALRDDVTNILRVLLNWLRYAEAVAPLLARAMSRSGKRHVVDLCSGSGGPWRELLPLLATDQAVSVVLTDKFPNFSAAERSEFAGEQIGVSRDAVDAERVPATLRGFRTLFNSFHHFDPPQAERVLLDAVNRGEPVAIFEVPRRHPLAICAAVLMGIGAFVLVPFLRPFRMSLFFWTYVMPVIPFVMWFDGTVSCLRAYTPAELRRLSDVDSLRNYTWAVGTQSGGFPFLCITYLIGLPGRTTAGRNG